MTPRHFVISFILLLSAHVLFADGPPSWRKFRIDSKNRRFSAVVDIVAEDRLKQPWDAKWTLKVYENINQQLKVIWTTSYNYSGYPGGLLSNDGKYFIYLEFWYYDDVPLLQIYTNGHEVNSSSLTGRDFHIPSNKLIETASHKLWVSDSDDAKFLRMPGHKAFIVTTVDKKKHLIDLDTGTFLKSD